VQFSGKNLLPRYHAEVKLGGHDLLHEQQYLLAMTQGMALACGHVIYCTLHAMISIK
jgi:hypothetical protein